MSETMEKRSDAQFVAPSMLPAAKLKEVLKVAVTYDKFKALYGDPRELRTPLFSDWDNVSPSTQNNIQSALRPYAR